MTLSMDQAQKLRDLMVDKKQKNSGARIISITSGKGGVGKTNLTVNLAIALANFGKRVVVFDADFGFANIDVLLGTKSKYDLGHVIRGEKTISEVIALGHGGIKFISGGAGLTELLELKNDKLQQIIQDLVELDDIADYIIFDTGAGVNEKILSIINAGDEVILIYTPEPTSIMDAFVMAKTIASKNKNPLIKLVVNRAYSEEEARTTLKNFKSVISKHLKIEPIELGYILQDENVVQSIKQQLPTVLAFPESIASKNILLIANKYTNTEAAKSEPEQRGITNFIQRLKKSRV